MSTSPLVAAHAGWVPKSARPPSAATTPPPTTAPLKNDLRVNSLCISPLPQIWLNDGHDLGDRPLWLGRAGDRLLVEQVADDGRVARLGGRGGRRGLRRRSARKRTRLH